MRPVQEGSALPQPEAMETGTELTVVEPSGSPAEAQPPVVLVGRLVSLRYVLFALRRRRKLWLSLAAVGLVLGLAYHAVVPRSFSATTTLYLAHSPGTDDGVDMANDLALLQTSPVAERAASLLGDPNLTASELLGKEPGTAVSDNILTIEVSGPSKAEAVRRANAVAEAYLGFRKQRSEGQFDATASALRSQINELQKQVNSLSTRISNLGTSAQGAAAASLVGEQSADTGEIANLQQTLQQDQIGVLTQATGSRILTPGTLVPASTKKLFLLSGISGLIAGLAIGVGLVALQAVVSDRVRRRDEVASLLGAPVEFSLRPVGHARGRSENWVKQAAVKPQKDVAALAGYLRRHGVSQGRRTTLLVVALDDQTLPAAALAALAKRLVDEGHSVLVVDQTSQSLLAHGVEDLRVDGPVGQGPGALHVLTSPPDDIGEFADSPPWVANPDGPQAVLVLSTVEPARGAWHLSWAKEAVVSVTAGQSSAQRVSSTAVLLRAAGVTLRCGVLLGADAQDESIGLLQPDSPLIGLPVNGVVSA